MSLEDYTTPWIEEVFAALDSIDLATIEAPHVVVGPRDVVIGELPVSFRRFYALTMRAMEDYGNTVNRADVKFKATGIIDPESQQALHCAKNYLNVLDAIFRISLHENFVAWNSDGIGVALGWKVVVSARAKISGIRTPILDRHWLVRAKAELAKISYAKILRPFLVDGPGIVIGNIRAAPGMQRLYALRRRYFAQLLRARANFFEASRNNNRVEAIAIEEWRAKEECVKLIFWESVAQLLDRPWAKSGTLGVCANWDVVWIPPDVAEEEEV